MPYPTGHRLSALYGQMMDTPLGKEVVNTQKELRKIYYQDDIVKKVGTGQVYNAVEKHVRDSIDSAVYKEINRQAKILEDENVYLFSKLEKEKIAVKYDPDKTFKGNTLKKRLNVIEKQTKKGIDVIKNMQLKSDDEAVAVKHYLSGHKAGQNSFRPTSRLTISEMNRAKQTAAREIGKFFEEKKDWVVLYKWNLSTLPNRKYDICDEYAKGQASFGYRNVGYGMWESEHLPGYPHPFCYCQINVLPRKMEIISEKKVRIQEGKRPVFIVGRALSELSKTALDALAIKAEEKFSKE